MVLRKVKGFLKDQIGDAVPGVTVTFRLVDADGNPTDSFDAQTFERVVSTLTQVVTDENGYFEVDLWPTSRAAVACMYECKVRAKNVNDFVSPLVDGEGDLDWTLFRILGEFPSGPSTSGASRVVASDGTVWELVITDNGDGSFSQSFTRVA